MKNPLRKAVSTLLNQSPEFVQNLFLPIHTSNQLKELRNRFGSVIPEVQRNRNFENEVRKYWKEKLGLNINPAWHLFYSAFTGQNDVRFISQYIWGSEIHLTLNHSIFHFPTFGDKNFSDTLFGKKYLPITVVKRIQGRFYDDNNNIITQDDAFYRIQADRNDKIVKPSLMSRGQMVFSINCTKESIWLGNNEIQKSEFLDLMGDNFIVQQKVEQHPDLAKPHPSSLNTLRICTLRLNTDIYELISIFKIGSNNKVTDNSSVILAVNSYGITSEIAYDMNLNEYNYHPTTGYLISKLKTIPNYREAATLCKELHKKVPHMDFAAWDVAITPNGTPCIIEVNSNPSVWLYQLINKKPFFDDLTDEVLHWVRTRKNKSN